jgi:hypothetical protein
MSMAVKTKTWAAAGIATLALLAPAAAQAKPFTTDAFSIELGETPICFAVPVSLRDAAACRGLPPLGAGDIDNTQVGLIAAGGIRRAAGERETAGAMPLTGLLQIFQVPASLQHQPDSAYAERVAVEATKAILANLPSEARRGRPVPRVENVDGLVVVRTSVEVDGLAPGTRASFFAHIETATVFGRDATTTVVWSGPQAAAATLTHLADDASKTMRLTADHRPAMREASSPANALISKALFPLLGLVFAGGLWFGIRRNRGRGNRSSRSSRMRADLWPTNAD